jgi:hypothetical protein
MINQTECGRDHVRRQAFEQVLAQLGGSYALAGFSRKERDQLSLSRLIRSGDDCAFAHLRMLIQRCFNLATLDSKTADLKLQIGPANKRKLTITSLSHRVSRSIESLPSPSAEGIGHESFRR